MTSARRVARVWLDLAVVGSLAADQEEPHHPAAMESPDPVLAAMVAASAVRPLAFTSSLPVALVRANVLEATFQSPLLCANSAVLDDEFFVFAGHQRLLAFAPALSAPAFLAIVFLALLAHVACATLDNQLVFLASCHCVTS